LVEFKGISQRYIPKTLYNPRLESFRFSQAQGKLYLTFTIYNVLMLDKNTSKDKFANKCQILDVAPLINTF
jgi:hypothetical protein